MNVLQAFQKTKELNDVVEALDKSIFYLNINEDFRKEILVLTKVKEKYVKEAEELKMMLENTALANKK